MLTDRLHLTIKFRERFTGRSSGSLALGNLAHVKLDSIGRDGNGARLSPPTENADHIGLRVSNVSHGEVEPHQEPVSFKLGQRGPGDPSEDRADLIRAVSLGLDHIPLCSHLLPPPYVVVQAYTGGGWSSMANRGGQWQEFQPFKFYRLC